MATVLAEILESFYTKLAESDSIDDETIKAIRELFESGAKLKADDFVKVLSAEGKEAAS